VRQEFPAEWAKFQNQKPADGHRFELVLNLLSEHYPFWSQGRVKAVTRVDVLAASKVTPIPGSIDIADKADKNDRTTKIDSLAKDASLGGLLVGKFQEIALPAPEGDLSLFIDDNSLNNLWIGLTWGEA